MRGGHVKIVVFGAGGQVGREVLRTRWPSGFEILAFDRAAVDITSRKDVFSCLERERPGLALNLAAYTAVDRAESEADRAWLANAEGPRYIAEACAAIEAAMLHLSTDYVFDGSKQGPYNESDPVSPIGEYGRSKEAGEQAIRNTLSEHIILRTSWVYGLYGHNFVKTILRLATERPVLRVVADQRGSPTAARDIAETLVVIAEHVARGAAPWGTFHFAGAGNVSWHGFAEAILGLSGPSGGRPTRVEPIATADYPTPARRPMNSVLDCTRLRAAFGIVPRPWQEALQAVMAELAAETAINR
ncbi:MAG: dTDP-4-dehydrorhamnose reductase [Alphaproteobacteria bacterium]|nr:dTDP-4-dehydrorhamnose reductase [Alphaproteobacteria bacterium]